MAVMCIVNSQDLKQNWLPTHFMGNPEEAQQQLESAQIMLKRAQTLVKNRKKALKAQQKIRKQSGAIVV